MDEQGHVYEVTSTIKHGGRRYYPGQTVALPDHVAVGLLASGHVRSHQVLVLSTVARENLSGVSLDITHEEIETYARLEAKSASRKKVKR